MTLTDTSASGPSEPESNGNEGVFYTPKISQTGTSLSDAVKCHTQHAPFSREVTLLLGILSASFVQSAGAVEYTGCISAEG